MAWFPNNPVDSNMLPNVRTDTPLRGDYQQAVAHVAGVDKDYQRELRSLLQTFPQGDGEVPTRPKPEQMQVLFEKVLFHDQVRPRGKGSKGGVKHYECKWPSCSFKGTLQKCMDHFFCEHVKLKFFKCDQPNCGITFLRKYDLDKHKKKQHSMLRPREQRSQGERSVAGPSRQTRSGGLVQNHPYSTQGRSTRRRPGNDKMRSGD